MSSCCSISHPTLWAPFIEAEKMLIPLYKRGGMRSHDGVVSFSHPALWASFTEAEKDVNSTFETSLLYNEQKDHSYEKNLQLF